jgi:hypothetical protein
MPYKHPSPHRLLRTIAIVGVSMFGAFLLGVETAGDIQPMVHSTMAGNAVVEGDFNGNGVQDVDDVKIALELAKGYRTPTPHELAADPNHDYVITVDDAMAVLDILERLPGAPKVQL